MENKSIQNKMVIVKEYENNNYFNFRFMTIISLFCLSTAIVSCSKETSILDNAEEQSLIPLPKKNAKLPGMESGTLTTYPITYVNGSYTSLFAGGLNFGSTFAYPTNRYEFGDYTPWFPYFGSVTSNANLLSFEVSDHKFVAVFGTAVNGFVLKFDIVKYFKELEKGGTLSIGDYITRTDGSSDGLSLIKGKFLIDYTSPLGVSIADVNALEGGVVDLGPGI